MAESDVALFIFWSIVTVTIMGITGFSYRSYIRKRKNEHPTS